MKITGFGQNNNKFKQSFGADFDIITRSICSKARCDAFRHDISTPDKFDARMARIKNMHPNYYITAVLEQNKHSLDGDFYRFSIVPSTCNKSCAKLLKDIKANTPALVIMAHLERALKKFRP